MSIYKERGHKYWTLEIVSEAGDQIILPSQFEEDVRAFIHAQQEIWGRPATLN